MNEDGFVAVAMVRGLDGEEGKQALGRRFPTGRSNMQISTLGGWSLRAMFSLALVHTASGADGTGHYYRYFDQKMPLVLDGSRIAVFRDTADATVAGRAEPLSKYGIAADGLTATAFPKLSHARTPATVTDETGVRALVSSIAANGDADFVSPVFLDSRGLPLVITQDLLIGFQPGLAADAAEQILVNTVDGQILDRDWTGMKGVYRVRCTSRDGFSVLEKANELADRADVRFAEPDLVSKVLLDFIPNDPLFGSLWGLHNTGQSGGTIDMDMDAPEAWDTTIGSPSIIVVVLDAGVQQDHPDIHQIPGNDLTGNGTGGGPLNACDDHGTCVAGCVSGTINNSIGVSGVAPGAVVASAKVFITDVPCANTGTLQSSWVINALAWAETIGARVTNTSLGFSSSAAVSNKYQSTHNNGIVHCAATGNAGTNNIGYPSSAPGVNAIGALTRSGARASFSQFGTGLDLSAPGQSIVTTDRTGTLGYAAGDYTTIDGTSFASPYAAGVAALVLSANSGLNADQVDQILWSSAVDLGAAGYDTGFGWGFVNANGAVALADPTNLTCADAVQISCNSAQSVVNTQVDNIPSYPYSCGNGHAHNGTVWYKFTATRTSASISTCDSAGTDSTFAVFGGSCGALVPLACVEDGGCNGAGLGKTCVSGLTIGNTYYIEFSSQTAAERGQYSIQVDCSCNGACCTLPPIAGCQDVKDNACSGEWRGPGTVCTTDQDLNGVNDACETTVSKVSQLPAEDQEDLESDVDLVDLTPNVVLADDFTSDGRPITTVRWWGSPLSGTTPDGWAISFHEPLVVPGVAAEALGVYYCGSSVVRTTAMPFAVCDAHLAAQFEVDLVDCCLVHSNADSRSSNTPAKPVAFQEEECFDYDLSIQAIIGHEFTADGFGGCTETVTGNTAAAPFWGWHSTTREVGSRGAIASTLSMAGSDWLYGPWSVVAPACGGPNLAFELLTTTPSGTVQTVFWDNGNPNKRNILNSQYGGELSDYITADDFTLPTGGTINKIEWRNEEEFNFQWDNKVRLEIYPDGPGFPDEGFPILSGWVPDDFGAVTRTNLGGGQFEIAYRYEVTGLNLVLPPGTYWLATATAGVPATTGLAYWATSHTTPFEPALFGNEAHLRAPSAGVTFYFRWDDILPNSNKFDMSFKISTLDDADCNCNGIPDEDDIAALTSLDCNLNGVPDECERDCNDNGQPDDCDIADLSSPDCNTNGTPDECDVMYGTVIDVDDNNVPDLCECAASPAPMPGLEPGGVPKNRYISIAPGGTGRYAIRVRRCTGDCSGTQALEYWWAGAPTNPPEGGGGGNFSASALQCTPHFGDWTAIPVLHLHGQIVMPGNSYEIRAIEEHCVSVMNEEYWYSAPRIITMGKWADVTIPFGGAGQPNFQDVSAIVAKFQTTPTAISKTRAQLQPAVVNPNNPINFQDVSQCVGAFQGKPYPYAVPAACP